MKKNSYPQLIIHVGGRCDTFGGMNPEIEKVR